MLLVSVHLLGQGQAGGHGNALSQRAGGLGDTRQALAHGGMALQAGTQLAKGAQFAHREVPGTGQDRIINGGQVAGGEDELVLSLAVTLPGGGVMVHHFEVQGSARVAGFGRRDHADNVPAHLRCNFLKLFFCHICQS